MAPNAPTFPSDASPGGLFATTRWSVIRAAAARSDSPQAREALSRLCQSYWYPLYAFARRRGYSAHDAQDLTQEFFCRLLEREPLESADPSHGRFRSFLLASMNHFLVDQWRKQSASKRGGNQTVLSINWIAADERFDLEQALHATPATPDRIFDREWALALLDQVLERLEAEHKAEGKLERFALLKESLQGVRESEPYAELAEKLGMTESAVKVTVHRLRKRYRTLIRAEIANTLENPEEVEEEIRHLFRALEG
jgi:RNA polymerase sigma-70 factor (ECF subfamily)